MEAFLNPFFMILFVLTMIVISLSVISVRIQKNNKIQKKSLDQMRIRSEAGYSAIGVYFQGDRTLAKCPHCAEMISVEAKICKECKSNVEDYMIEVRSQAKLQKEKNEEIRIRQKAKNMKRVFPNLLLILLLWVTFQTGLELSQMDDYLAGAPPSVPILFVIITLFLLGVLPKMLNTSNSGFKNSKKLWIIKAVIWILVLAIFLIYSYSI